MRLAGAVVPQVKMWAVFADGVGGVVGEQILFLNLYSVFTAGEEDFAISVPVTSPDGMSLEEHEGYHGDLVGVSVGNPPRPEEWTPRIEYRHRVQRRQHQAREAAPMEQSDGVMTIMTTG